MGARNYTSHPQAGQQGKPRTWTFRLDGEQFACTLRQDADAVMEWSEIASTAVSAEGDEQLESAAGLAFTARFFKLMMTAGEYTRFRAHLRTHRTEPDVLAEIMRDVNAAMEDAVGAASGRPTGPPSRSSAGRTATGGRTSQIISLHEGDIEWADPPPQRRGPNRAQRRAARRKAG
jgi:hypothetical protein